MVSPGLGILGRLGTPAMTPIIPKRVNDLHLKVPNLEKWVVVKVSANSSPCSVDKYSAKPPGAVYLGEVLPHPNRKQYKPICF